jgi:hypothetical protein
MPLAKSKGTDVHKGLPNQDLRFEVKNEESAGVSILKRATTTFRERYDMSWELRSALGVARDAEFFHPAAKGIRVEIQDLGRAARADPICLLEDLHDVIPFHPFQGQVLGCLRGRAGEGKYLRVDLQDGSVRQDHRAFDDILQLPDVPRAGSFYGVPARCLPVHVALPRNGVGPPRNGVVAVAAGVCGGRLTHSDRFPD